MYSCMYLKTTAVLRIGLNSFAVVDSSYETQHWHPQKTQFFDPYLYLYNKLTNFDMLSTESHPHILKLAVVLNTK